MGGFAAATMFLQATLSRDISWISAMDNPAITKDIQYVFFSPPRPGTAKRAPPLLFRLLMQCD